MGAKGAQRKFLSTLLVPFPMPSFLWALPIISVLGGIRWRGLSTLHCPQRRPRGVGG